MVSSSVVLAWEESGSRELIFLWLWMRGRESESAISLMMSYMQLLAIVITDVLSIIVLVLGSLLQVLQFAFSCYSLLYDKLL